MNSAAAPGTLRSRKELFALLGLTATLLVGTMPAEIYPGDAFAFREEARNMLLHRSLDVGGGVQMPSAPGQYFVKNPVDGLYYSKYGVVNGLMSLPPLAAEWLLSGKVPTLVGTHRLLLLNLYNVVLSLLIAACLLDIVAEYVQRPAVRLLFVLSCLFATFLWNYLRAQSGEIFQVLFFAGFFRSHQRLIKQPDSLRLLLLPWLWIAALTLTRLSYGLLVPLYAIALLTWLRTEQTSPARRLLRIAFPVAAIAALVMVLNIIKFGSAFHGGYDVWHPDWHRPASLAGVLGFLVDPQRSIFVHFPVLLPAVVGWPGFLRRYRGDALLLLVIFVAFLFALGSLPSWRGEWSYGPRYLCFLLPLLSLPAATWFDDLFAAGPQWIRRTTVAVVAPLFLWSCALQWGVNMLEFFAYYRLSGWVSMPRYVESHRYFEHRTFGRTNWDLILAAPEYDRLPYVREFVANVAHSEKDDLAYLDLIRGVREHVNLYWWGGPIGEATLESGAPSADTVQE